MNPVFHTHQIVINIPMVSADDYSVVARAGDEVLADNSIIRMIHLDSLGSDVRPDSIEFDNQLAVSAGCFNTVSPVIGIPQRVVEIATPDFRVGGGRATHGNTTTAVGGIKTIKRDPRSACDPKTSRPSVFLVVNSAAGTPRRTGQMPTDYADGIVSRTSTVIARGELHLAPVDRSALDINGIAVLQGHTAGTA